MRAFFRLAIKVNVRISAVSCKFGRKVRWMRPSFVGFMAFGICERDFRKMNDFANPMYIPPIICLNEEFEGIHFYIDNVVQCNLSGNRFSGQKVIKWQLFVCVYQK